MYINRKPYWVFCKTTRSFAVAAASAITVSRCDTFSAVLRRCLRTLKTGDWSNKQMVGVFSWFHRIRRSRSLVLLASSSSHLEQPPLVRQFSTSEPFAPPPSRPLRRVVVTGPVSTFLSYLSMFHCSVCIQKCSKDFENFILGNAC